MSMTINSPLSVRVQVKDIFVSWNYADGHQTTGDKTLRLVSVSWEPPIWTGNSGTASSITIVPSPVTYVEPGASTLTFTFHQSYDHEDGLPTEQIVINLEPLACNHSISASYTQ
jgi:hypothetical protein